jgi:hypothetical protein
MTKRKGLLKFGLLCAALCLSLAFFSLRSLTAAFWVPASKTYVEIDGVNYGAFDNIQGLEQFDETGRPLDKSSSYTKITLNRDFVTEPSLYLWAKNRMSKKLALNDIYLVTEDDNGNEISRRVMQLCQPLSWTVEASNPAVGGFNETVDLAVQKISVE